MKFIYTNYKGETEERDIEILSLDFIRNPGLGYESGWFLTGRDRNRNGQTRSFRIDGRMFPTEADFNAPRHRHPGLSIIEYPISEGDAVRSAVDQIAQRVTEAVEQKRGEFGVEERKAD